MTPTVEPILHYRTSHKSPSIKKNSLSLPSTYLHFSTPPWIAIKPSINLQLTEFPKKSTSPITYRDRFQSLIINHPNSNICYTDGSRTINRTGLVYTLLTITYTRNVIVTPRQCLHNRTPGNLTHASTYPLQPFPPGATNYYRFGLPSSAHGHREYQLGTPLCFPNSSPTQYTRKK